MIKTLLLTSIVLLAGCSSKGVKPSKPIEVVSHEMTIPLTAVSELSRPNKMWKPKPAFTREEYMLLEQHQKERALTLYILELNTVIKAGNKDIENVNRWLDKYILQGN